MATTKRKEGYVRIGDVLRDALVEDIGSLAWEGPDKERADKIKSALQRAAPYRKGYLLDTNDWGWEDFDFLRTTLTSVEETEGHSHGVGGGFYNTRIGRQISALQEDLW